MTKNNILGKYFKQTILALSVLFCFLFNQSLHASHSMGGDLSYECLGDTDFDGNLEYLVSLSFYRDCAGIDASTSEDVDIESIDCGEFLSLDLEYDYFASGGIGNLNLAFDYPAGNSTGTIYYIFGSDLVYIDIATGDTTITTNFFDFSNDDNCLDIDQLATIDTTFSATGAITNITGSILNTGNYFGTGDIILGPNDELYNTSNEVSQICEEEITNTTCCGGTIPGVQEYVYTGIIELPAECDDWLISYSVGTRNDAISNLTTPGSQSMYLEALLSNEDGLCNSSPQFSSLPVPYFCIGQQSFYNHGAFDIDGNTLVYTLIQPLDDAGSPIDYEPGYSVDFPITTAPGDFNFDGATGQMSFIPSQEELVVVAVLVEEFDDAGNLIGSIMRDIQLVILQCDNDQAALNGGITGLSPDAIFIDSTTVEVCPGSMVIFDLVANDPDPGDFLTMNTNLASAIPAATFTTSFPTGATNAIEGHFEWQPTIDDVGLNSFSVVLQDDACPIPSSAIYGFNILVLEGANAGPDQTYCQSGGPATITANGGTNFVWTNDNPGGVNIISQSASGDELVVEVDQTTTFYLVTNLTSNCIINDTTIVYWAPDFAYTFPQDENICKFDQVALNYDVDPADGPYTFQWFPFDYLSENTIQNPIAEPFQTITYNCIATAATGCTVQEEVTITVQGISPIVNIVDGIDTQICAGEEVQLAVQTCCTECEISQNLTTFAQTPYFSGWDDQRMQLLFLVDELIDIGMNGCQITSLAFNVYDDGNNIPFTDFTISMENTILDDFAGINNFQTTTQQVFQADVDPVAGWNTHIFNVPFAWDGGSNVLINICHNNPDGSFGGNGDCQVSFNNTPFLSVFQEEEDNADGCTLLASNFATINSSRPDVIFGTNGTSPGTINWFPPQNLNSTTIANPIATPTETTLYTIEVSDNGCVGEDTITITVVAPQGYEAGPDTAVCGDANFPLFIDGPANPNFVYTWTPGTGISDINFLSDTNAASPILSVSELDFDLQYVVTISNTGGCDIIDTVDITFGSDINYYVPPDDTICLGETYPISISGGDIYFWTPAVGLSCYDCPSPIASPDSTITYSLTISTFGGYGIDCPIEEEFTLYVNPVPDVDIGNDLSFFKGEPVQLIATGNFNTIEWFPAAGISDSSSTEPTYYQEFDEIVFVSVENEFSCFDFDTISLRYLGCRPIVIPTAFSPNGDGQNDYLRIIETGETEFVDFTIYNRWGERVFYTNNTLNFWDGKFEGKQQGLGSYIWISRGKCDETEIIKRGNITLIR